MSDLRWCVGWGTTPGFTILERPEGWKGDAVVKFVSPFFHTKAEAAQWLRDYHDRQIVLSDAERIALDLLLENRD